MKPHHLKVFLIIAIVLFQSQIFSPRNVYAWTEQPLISYRILQVIPEVRNAEPVVVEDLDSFLIAEEKNLADLLAQEEKWARQNLSYYKPLPDVLAFQPTGYRSDVRQRFCHAIRVNPDFYFSLYLQLVPGEDAGGRTAITPREITFLKDTSDWKNTKFAELIAGESVSSLDVVVTATEEPDFGLDVGLYEDNGTDFGKVYGFGTQPFGNPNLEYGTQAPFHMGYYHEAGIINTFAEFITQTYPEYRIHLYQSLSRFAFETGHNYWGWRFMGMGLQYVIDLNQPYHVSLLPGVSVVKMIWMSMLDMVGISGPKADAIQLVSNRHTALEKFQQLILYRAYQDEVNDSPIFVVLRTIGECPPWNDRMPRDVITVESCARARETDRLLEETMPERFVSDPSFELGTSPERDDIILRIQEKGGQQAIDRLTAQVRDLLKPLPSYTCSYVRSIRNK
ncbi:MAG: hypothetical protein NT072_03760 [Deltaproteobacteria bacterium]|nr:hypothetical protein [Deltaproteobacteria bacterium]